MPILLLAYGVKSSVTTTTSPAARSFARWMWYGLVVCAAGDALLHAHDNQLRDDEGLFVAGLGAFLIGHLLYTVAFSVGGGLAFAPVAAVPLFAGADCLGGVA